MIILASCLVGSSPLFWFVQCKFPVSYAPESVNVFKRPLSKCKWLCIVNEPLRWLRQIEDDFSGPRLEILKDLKSEVLVTQL